MANRIFRNDVKGADRGTVLYLGKVKLTSQHTTGTLLCTVPMASASMSTAFEGHYRLFFNGDCFVSSSCFLQMENTGSQNLSLVVSGSGNLTGSVATSLTGSLTVPYGLGANAIGHYVDFKVMSGSAAGGTAVARKPSNPVDVQVIFAAKNSGA